MSSPGSNGSPSPPPALRRGPKRVLRQATWILPQTGERVRRAFTLNAPFRRRSGTSNGELEPLLPRSSSSRRRRTKTVYGLTSEFLGTAYKFITSPNGIAILKCSIAYLLASLATLTPTISGLLGHNDGKHMVATVVVYFHPARTAGSMIEATLLAVVAYCYSAAVAFASMAVTVAFRSQGLLHIGHMLVLVVFCGGGLGFVGWLKQRMSSPLVNVACSLASLTIITALTKEGPVQLGNFNYEKISQVLRIVLMGICAATGVSLLIKPQSARFEVRKDLVQVTDHLEEMLARSTTAFLAGSEDELKTEEFAHLSDKYRDSFNLLLKNYREARFEHYILGTESVHKVTGRLIKCIESLGHSAAGLRSAATTQFAVISQGNTGPQPRRPMTGYSFLEPNGELPSIFEEPEDSDGLENEQPRPLPSPGYTSNPADIFSFFIAQLGPSMKSLAYTLKEVLHELPFGPGPEYDIVFNCNFRRSLLVAKNLFADSRKEALERLYRQKVRASTSHEVIADYEEVGAACGYFGSSLQDFAEDMVQYLDILAELKKELETQPRRRSWHWLNFWHPRSRSHSACEHYKQLLADEGPARRLSVAGRPRPLVTQVVPAKMISSILWKAYKFVRRDDVRYAIKVGIGAILYAMFSFIPETRPYYAHWRGEWGLLSYMLVCSMTIGASNTTGLQRVWGTGLGAVFAILAWIVADDNPWVLGFIGWLASLACFHIILVLKKGPLGRFVFLTYNLSALYAYSLSAKDDDDDDDEGGIDPAIWEIVLHRVVAVLIGCLWGLVVSRLIYPISARRNLRDGLAVLWLRMGLIWKRDPLTILVEGDDGRPRAAYMDIREAIGLQRFLTHLEGLRGSARHEFELRGPFPDRLMNSVLDATSRMLAAFHAMNVVIVKELKASPGEAELLRFTQAERVKLSARISHLFSVLASSVKLEYPMNDALPDVEHVRDRFLAKIFEYREQNSAKKVATEEDFELFYAYALVTKQIADEIKVVFRLIEQLYGKLDEDSLILRGY
ncbi:hypothetical protein EJ06DRAFT_528642 [Trichodelitschia bisporula]|uniref:Integral membrane bound transporter domain-containing protein n=1 Tax=Trichodelitschia bisporula TaxID=703511 RepID=A0A6G1I2X4_9PEZI|nr:hypothetical protein EJ06DRAFT_528642 [Trichodelitschia bisporula]